MFLNIRALMPPSLLETLFPATQFPTQFLAMGCLFGRFTPSLPTEENQKLHFIRGTLQINEVVYLDVSLYSRLWLKLSKDSTFNPETAYLWRVFFRTTTEGKLTLVELIRNIPINGHLSLNNPPPPSTGIDQFYIRGEICYSDEQKFVLQLRRNQKPPLGYEKSKQWKPFLITVSSGLPQAKKGEFWEVFCQRKGESLVLTKAHPINHTSVDSTPALTILSLLAPTQSDSYSSNRTEAHLVEKKPVSTLKDIFTKQSNVNQSPNQVIMIPGKQAEITVKFNTRPSLPEVGKTVALEITTEQGFAVRANVNRKTLKKQVEKMDTFADWIAALSGKIARIDPNGVIELEGASVVVFEKKPKEEVKSDVETEVISEVETKVQKSMI